MLWFSHFPLPSGRKRSRAFVALVLCAVVWLLPACSGSSPPVRTVETAPAVQPADSVVTIALLHLNDVYEITPVEGGQSGGLARVATLRRQLLQETPHTITLIAGDFFSPSALGTARVDGEPLAGRQMVAVLNAMGLDLATFGNHEFDLNEQAFYERLGESQFQWISGNVSDADGRAFPGVARRYVTVVAGPGGEGVRIGFIGTTLASNDKDYVSYTDPVETLRADAEALQDSVDILVAVTHLALDDDIRVAETIPEIDLVLGGHEHENVHVYRGPDLTSVLKADANARTVYVHRLYYNTKTDDLRIESQFQPITPTLADDPETAAVVQQWVDRAYAGFEAEGFTPDEVVTVLTEALDGREASVRNRSTTLTERIADAMLHEAGGSRLAVYNSGSIRIDDVLPVGPVTQYDVIRVLPFGGDVLTVRMKGSLLDSTLTKGVANRGTGGFLQTSGIEAVRSVPALNAWMVQNQPLDPDSVYTVAINDFLVSGRETGLGFLTFENPGLTLVETNRDIRMALVDELRRRYGAP